MKTVTIYSTLLLLVLISSKTTSARPKLDDSYLIRPHIPGCPDGYVRDVITWKCDKLDNFIHPGVVHLTPPPGRNEVYMYINGRHICITC